MNADVESARLVLARLGVTPEQLLGAMPAPAVVPTIAAYIEQVGAAMPAGTRAVYDSYWRRVVAEWGERRLDEITAL
jgi:integrase/recombinase XerC